jgi:hypothetical protein
MNGFFTQSVVQDDKVKSVSSERQRRISPVIWGQSRVVLKLSHCCAE